MNRRGFLKTIGTAVACFTVLPSASTYDRKWVRTNSLYVPNPDYLNAPYELRFCYLDKPSEINIIEIDRSIQYPLDSVFVHESFPVRFDKTWRGEIKYIQPFIAI